MWRGKKGGRAFEGGGQPVQRPGAGAEGSVTGDLETTGSDVPREPSPFPGRAAPVCPRVLGVHNYCHSSISVSAFTKHRPLPFSPPQQSVNTGEKWQHPSWWARQGALEDFASVCDFRQMRLLETKSPVSSPVHGGLPCLPPPFPDSSPKVCNINAVVLSPSRPLDRTFSFRVLRHHQQHF